VREIVGKTNSKQLVATVFSIFADNFFDSRGTTVADRFDFHQNMVLSGLELEFCSDRSTHPVIAMTPNDIVLLTGFVNPE
jgi:hypothetical protein